MDPARRSSAASQAELIALLAIVLLALALRVPLLGRGLHYDELQTAVNFVDAPTAWQTISRVYAFNNHYFYSLLARGAVAVLGRAEWVLRLPALLLGIATLPLVWYGVRREFGSWVALLTALALATSAIHVGFSVSARGYTGLIFFSWLSCVLFLKLAREPGGGRTAAAYAVLTALGIWTHLYAAVVFAVQLLVLAMLLRSELRAEGMVRALARFRPVLAGAGGVVLLSLLLYAPALPRFLPVLLTGHPGSFVLGLPAEVLMYLSGRGITPAGAFLAAAALAGLAVGLRDRVVRRGVTLLFAVPLAAAWLARQDSHRNRFFVFLLPLLALGLALGAAWLWRRASRVAPGPPRTIRRGGATALLLLTGCLWGSRPWSNTPRGGFREAVTALEAPPRTPGARVGTCAIGIGANFYAWYAARPIFIPKTLEEFTAFVAAHDEVRCAWMDSPSDTPVHAAIGAILESRCGPAEPHHVLQVYRCHPSATRP